MPSTREGALTQRGEAVHVRGLAGLQRALKRGQAGIGPRLRRELRDIANDVRDTARTYVPHKTGRHGGANVPHLAGSIKSSVTASGAAVVSDAPHAIVQDVGGRVGHGAILRRDSVSHYMTQAVQDAQPYVTRRLETMLDEIERDFVRD